MQEKNLLNSNRTIAVFDDDADLLEIFRFVLEEQGYKVVTFGDCSAIVEKVRECNPVLLLMDSWIPELGGEKAIKKLKTQDDLKHIPIILVSACNDVAETAKRAGANAYIAKPFDLSLATKMITELAEG